MCTFHFLYKQTLGNPLKLMPVLRAALEAPPTAEKVTAHVPSSSQGQRARSQQNELDSGF